MKRSRKNSRLEIWGVHYINFPDTRDPVDQNAKILQIEPTGASEQFIVEVIDTDEEVPYLV